MLFDLLRFSCTGKCVPVQKNCMLSTLTSGQWARLACELVLRHCRFFELSAVKGITYNQILLFQCFTQFAVSATVWMDVSSLFPLRCGF